MINLERRWELTDVGAIVWFEIQNRIIQQEATNKQLVQALTIANVRIGRLETALNERTTA